MSKAMTFLKQRYSAVSMRNCGYFLFFLVFLGIRLYGLGKHDFWYDEIGSIDYAHYPWGNWNAPLYWIFLHFWIKLFPLTEFLFRFPSAVFSFLSVVILFFTAKRVFGRDIALISALFMGLSPFQLWYAQEARDYSMVLCLSLASVFFLVKSLDDKRTSSFMAFMMISVLAAYTNYFMLFLVMGQLLVLFWQRRIKESFCYSMLFLVLFSFYMDRFLSKLIYVKEGFWITAPGWKSLFITIGNFILGYNSSLWLFVLCVVAASICCAWALINALLRNGDRTKKGIVLCVSLFLAPMTAIFLFSRHVVPIYLTRGLIIFSPYFYILLACGISLLRGITKTLVLLLFCAALFLCLHRFFSDKMEMPLEYHQGVFVKQPVRPIVCFLDRNMKPGDAVAITNQSIMPSLSFYRAGRNAALFFFFDPQYPDTTWQRPFQEDAVNIPLDKISLLGYDRFWILSLNWARDGNMDENSVAVNAGMTRDFILEYASCIEGVRIFRYVRKSPAVGQDNQACGVGEFAP